MNLKRPSVLLALLLLTPLLTACAQPAEKPSEVALYTTEKDGVTNLAFLDAAGDYQTCGIVAPPSEDGSLSYQGDGTVTFQVLDQDGAALGYRVSFSMDGADVHFVAASDAVDS